MNSARALAVVGGGFIVSGYPASAQDLSRYRAYALESSLASVITASGARLGDAKSLHERPARIQELEWRAPYVGSGSELADPVREITFTFYNDALYQVVVSYDHDRTEGLTNKDIIESLRPPTACRYSGQLGLEPAPGGSTPRYHRARAVGERRIIADAPTGRVRA